MKQVTKELAEGYAGLFSWLEIGKSNTLDTTIESNTCYASENGVNLSLYRTSKQSQICYVSLWKL